MTVVHKIIQKFAHPFTDFIVLHLHFIVFSLL